MEGAPPGARIGVTSEREKTLPGLRRTQRELGQSAKLFAVTWWRFIVGTVRRYRALRSSNPAPPPEPSSESSSEEWNRFIDQGWLQEWKPRHGRGSSLWVRRVGRELQVFNRPRLLRESLTTTSTATWSTALSAIRKDRRPYRGSSSGGARSTPLRAIQEGQRSVLCTESRNCASGTSASGSGGYDQTTS